MAGRELVARSLAASLFPMMPLHDVDLFGIYVTPASVCFAAAIAALFLVRALLDRLNVDRIVWNRALFDLAILMAMTSLMILSLRFGGV